MEKYGWREGKGLGREEKGNTEPLKVKLKFDNTGIGHDIGEEFKFHWWDHVFNKAAKNMSVDDKNGSVEIVRTEELQVSKKLSAKMNMYNGFVKGGTLHKSEILKDSDSDDSDESVERDLSHKLTDEELFKLCGGRTAHKGARHGLSMSAKLARVQEQEQKLMEKWKSTEQQHQTAALSNNQEEKKKKKKKKKSVTDTHMEESLITEDVKDPVEDVSLAAVDEGAERKKKKKKKKSKNRDPSENNEINEMANSIQEEEVGVTHKSKKKKKKHDKDRENGECPPSADIFTDIQEKKKHKKSKHIQRDPEEELNLNEKENMEAEINETVQSSEEEKKIKKKKKKKHKELREDQELSNVEESNEPKKKKRKKETNIQ